MRSLHALASVPLVLLAQLVLTVPNRAQDSLARAKQLFVANCATCHGETGDGKGTTQLDRPARSFMDGGFSFGNTPEALFRTISVGIPGTPMPGFDSSLSEEERKLVAEYVVTLGPPIEPVDEEDTILTVRDKPLVVRGLLPPIAEGAPPQPRGLLIGDPSGITFEYRVDDVRLLGLRQGGFVKRTDWSGRGGTPLEPLGKVVQLVRGGKPDALFSLAESGKRLDARLSGTRIRDGVTLEYHLVSDGAEIAHVEEEPRVATFPFGTGFVRRFALAGSSTRTLIALDDPTQGPGEELFTARETGKGKILFADSEAVVSVRRALDGAPTFALLFADAPERHDGRVMLAVEPRGRTYVSIATVALAEWNDDVRAQIEEALR